MAPVQISDHQSSRLEEYLRSLFGNSIRLSDLTSLDGGSRHEAMKLTLRGCAPQPHVLIRSEGKRRESEEKLYRQNISLEFRTLKALAELGKPVPAVYGIQNDPSIIGQEFFVEEFIEGKALRKQDLLGKARMREIYLGAIASIADTSVEELGPVADDLPKAERCSLMRHIVGQAQRQLEDDCVGQIAAWLEEHCPGVGLIGMSNGDPWPSNYLVDDNGKCTVIDFEFAGFFDMEFELTSYTEHYTDLRDSDLSRHICQHYALDEDTHLWYRALFYLQTWTSYVIDGVESDPDSDVRLSDCRDWLRSIIG